MSDSPSEAAVGQEDLLADALTHYQLRARVYASPTVCGAWRLNMVGHGAGFHLLVAGQCWLHQQNCDPQQLRAGDLVFVVRDCWHVLSPEAQLDDDTTLMVNEGDSEALSLICGAMEFAEQGADTLLSALPDLLVLSADEQINSKLQMLAALMSAEAMEHETQGRSVVLDRLSDVLIVLVFRHVMGKGDVDSGLLAAMRDPRLSKALMKIHRDYQEDWTLEKLALEAGLSRSAFARQFQTVMQDSPMNYLTRWRMQQAEILLRDRRYSVAQIAGMLGYETDAAFRRAFKRIRGQSPGAVRRMSAPSD